MNRRQRLRGWWIKTRLKQRILPDPLEPVAFTGDVAQIAAGLRTGDPKRSAEILIEAKAFYDRPAQRAEHAEQRATTLLGATAIAASFALAGASLLLDPTRVHGRYWRDAFAVGLAAVVLSLIGAALRALQMLTRRQTWHVPDEGNISAFASAPGAPEWGQLLLAASYLNYFGKNDPNADLKVGYLQAAAWWLRWALIALGLVSFLIVIYVAYGPEAATLPTTR